MPSRKIKWTKIRVVFFKFQFLLLCFLNYIALFYLRKCTLWINICYSSILWISYIYFSEIRFLSKNNFIFPKFKIEVYRWIIGINMWWEDLKKMRDTTEFACVFRKLQNLCFFYIFWNTLFNPPPKNAQTYTVTKNQQSKTTQTCSYPQKPRTNFTYGESWLQYGLFSLVRERFTKSKITIQICLLLQNSTTAWPLLYYISCFITIKPIKHWFMNWINNVFIRL